MNTDITQILLNMTKGEANLQLADPGLLHYYQLAARRIIWLDGEIADNSLDIIDHILVWNLEDEGISPEKRVPILILFFSPGGDLDVNYALFDTIAISQTPIWGLNLGKCSSAAAYIFLACQKRFMLPHGYFLFHQGYGGVEGEFSTIVEQMKDYQRQVDDLSTIIATHTDYSIEEIQTKIIGEWYIRADEALQKGVVNQVVDNISLLLNRGVKE